MKKVNSLAKVMSFITVALLAISATGCNNETQETENNTMENSVSDSENSTSENSDSINNSDITDAEPLSVKNTSYSELFSDKDLNPDFSNISAEITLNGDSAVADSEGVSIDGSQILITQEGTYKVSGTLYDGQIIVNAPDAKVQIILDNADISCSTSSAIYGLSSKKIFISLAENSVNSLTDGEYVYTDDNTEPDSCIFSKDSLTINGTGSLDINSTLTGIHSKDDIVITGGNITITSAKDGIKGKDYIAIADGNFNITCGEDGLKSTNTADSALGFVYIENGEFTINSGQDGIQAESDVTVKTGNINITSGGGNENFTKTHSDMQFGKDMSGGFNHGNGRFNQDSGDMQMPDNFGDMQMPDNFGDMQKPDNFGDMQMPDNFGDMQMPDNFGDMQENQSGTAETSISTKGIKGGLSVNIYAGNIKIDSADDSVHSNGDVNIKGGILEILSGNKGIHADSEAIVANGSVSIQKSYEGIEATVIEVQGGNIDVTSSDDGFNASDGVTNQGGMGTYSENIQVIIKGGYIEIDASGDGIDSNGDITINDGTVIVNGSVSGGDSALDSNGSINVNGGTLIALGMHDMVECPDDTSAQCVISVTFDEIQSENTVIDVFDSDNNPVINYTSIKNFDNVIVSSPDIQKSKTYSISLDGTEYESITIDNIISTIGQQSTMGGSMGGFGGGRGNRGDFQMPTNENGEVEMPDRDSDRTYQNPAENL